jgi:hypothetical protein
MGGGRCLGPHSSPSPTASALITAAIAFRNPGWAERCCTP